MKLHASQMAGLLALLLLAGCAHWGEQDPHAELLKSVTAHWQYKQEKQWDKAYNAFCKDVREQQSRTQYIQGANLDTSAFRIEEVVLTEDGKAGEVTVVFDAVVQGFTLKGIQLKEQWRYENDGWCLAPSGTLKDLFSR
ncbi:hypothetical protein [Desulfatitalea alkaliphila]|uniref:NTF2-like N-terminal transpeptidase domain-containing protein n=1 Tax=Desulfatitalea alkaliphila TaxID=2929485 RepID=A0AA41R545_9BACT|nr:hypothetical protein [Desulfatitalea alkaliphila]MCJ8499388.1 hypothetical protein [Desulfatitalea alkaliphila]